MADDLFDSAPAAGRPLADRLRPRTLELADGLGQTTRIEFEDTQRNGPIPAARFHFTPPAGIDVIRGLPQAPGR